MKRKHLFEVSEIETSRGDSSLMILPPEITPPPQSGTVRITS